ncbi:hypothetical protein QYL93_28785 [Acidovorax sp. A1169]|nr:hypothetical protein [Acidovorax sp. A1169]
MRNISQSFRFIRAARAPIKSQASAATDALSAITVWRALDGDRSIRVLVDEREDVLVAELTFTQGHLEAAMNDLSELCAENGIDRELIAQTR